MLQPRRSLLVLHEHPLALGQNGRFDMQKLASWAALSAALRESRPGVLALVDPYYQAPRDRGPSTELPDLLRRFPSASVVVAVWHRKGGYHDLFLLAQWGIAEVIHLDEDNTAAAITLRLSATSMRAVRQVSNQLPLLRPGRGRAILDAAVDVANEGGHPRELAQVLRVSASTLQRWHRACGLPQPRRLLLWIRALYAGALLDDPGHTVNSVALACGYSSDRALRAGLRAVVPHNTAPNCATRARSRRSPNTFCTRRRCSPRRATPPRPPPSKNVARGVS